MNQKLAIDGGVPVRENKPWPGWPQVDSEEWETEIEPRMRQVCLSGSEGLPRVQSEA